MKILTKIFVLFIVIVLNNNFMGMLDSNSLTQIVLAQDNPQEKKTWYTCGMHPEVIEDHPGDCPKCGMKLLPMSDDRVKALGLESSGSSKKEKGERKVLYWKSPMVSGEIHESAGKDSMGHDLVAVYQDEVSSAGEINISPIVTQNMGVRIAPVIRGNVVKTIRNVGFVNFDETTLTTVTTKVDGWIEKLYVEKTGSQVHIGDKLFELYSPELYSAQEEYLSALRNKSTSGSEYFNTPSLASGAETRLDYFDISKQQIDELRKLRQPKKTLTINAPSTGIVTHKGVVSGQMIKAGQELFRIADLSSVWVIVKVFESDLPFIEVGQSALMNLDYLPGKTFRGVVTYIYPYLDEKAREISVRIEFHNPGYELKPGMYATVKLSKQLKENAVLVPDLAVIDTGQRKVVFIAKGQGRFQMKNVTIGTRSENNKLEVLSGLTPGENVVISGQFLLDSESRLREAALKFLKPKGETPEKVSGEEAIKETSETQNVESKIEGKVKGYFVCPMPEHMDILYDKEGKCPICGMDLVPLDNPVEPKNSNSSPLKKEPTHE